MPGAIGRKARISRSKPERSRTEITAIEKFARVSKIAITGKEVAAKAIAAEAACTTRTNAAPRNARKRRATSPPSGSDADSEQPHRSPSRTALASPVKRLCRRPDGTSASSNASFATEQAERLLKRLDLHTTSSEPLSRPSPQTIALPQAVIDLLNLHAAFLKTLALHFSHNGTNAPVDVADICPSIAQAWGKRKVTVDDIRRCLGVAELQRSAEESSKRAEAPYALFNHGRGRICVELREGSSPAVFSDAQHSRNFESGLRMLWSAHIETANPDVGRFEASLPKADISPSRNVPRVLSNLANARRVLEEIKQGAAKKQQRTDCESNDMPMLNADGTKMSLLDRIRHKQQQLSQAPAPPTPEELERRAALHRADDVAAVIAMLATATAAGQGRVAFTMATVLLRLKDSLRVPVSQQEGRACVQLLAGEIAPQWLRVVTVAGRENVVVQSNFQPSKTEILNRVKALMV